MDFKKIECGIFFLIEHFNNSLFSYNLSSFENVTQFTIDNLSIFLYFAQLLLHSLSWIFNLFIKLI